MVILPEEGKAMAKKSTGAEVLTSIETSLSHLAEKLDQSSLVRRGQIVLHLTGSVGGDICVDCGVGKTNVAALVTRLTGVAPVIEITGDADVVRAVLAGEKDALKQFAAGGLRIRGDLRYFSHLALELGIIHTPL